MLLPVGQHVARAQYQYDPGDFAVTIGEYVEGTGVGSDYISGDPFDDPYAALGRPTVDTTGDRWNIPLDGPVPVVPVYPAFRSYEVVSIGLDGQIILVFDHPVVNEPRNPYGIDFVVFGNASQAIAGGAPWTNGDPNDMIAGPSGLIEPGAVSVSQDGQSWYTFTDSPIPGTDAPSCDVFAPTLGRVYDPDNPDMSIGQWNEWWGVPTDPTWPLDPRLTWSDFGGQTVADIAQTYEESAGGTGFDLEWLPEPGLDWIQYVRIVGPSAGGTPELDAVSDVFPRLGDFDRDDDLDLADFARFQACFTGPGNVRTLGGCFPADFDGNLVSGDMDVDLDDYEQFAQYFTGPGTDE
ncbi:MAG TPA: hypothetical protein VM243_20305 [Phycisphaerae bacterium]|nr:hypothetical protein [Phycisphaerae bacterium]